MEMTQIIVLERKVIQQAVLTHVKDVDRMWNNYIFFGQENYTIA